MENFKLFLKRFLCIHSYTLTRWHWVHFPDYEPLSVETEYICSKCGKTTYSHIFGANAKKWADDIGDKLRVN